MRRIDALVLATASVLLANACGQAGPELTADLVLSGGTVLTGDGAASADAVAVGNGRIVAVGTAAQLESLVGPATVVVPLDGAAVTPAFVDHHVHLLNIGLSLLNRELEGALYIDLAGMNQEQIAAALRSRAAAMPEGSWLLGKGWSQGYWGNEMLPDEAVLDRAAPENPTFLTRAGGHTGWANSRALAAAGIDAGWPDPPGGRVMRGAGDAPTGVLLERANEPVLALLPRPSGELLRRAFRLAAEALAANGVTEVFDAGFLTPPGVVGLNDDLQVYLNALLAEDAAAPLPLRVHLMIPAPSALAEAVLADPALRVALSPRIDVTHLKLFGDGAMGNRGASLSHPFADDPTTHGVPRMTVEEIRAWSERALDAGLDVATHAIGDATLGRALDVYEALLRERADLDPGRLRIEHVSYGSTEDLQRVARLGVVLSIQPNFVAPGDDGVTMEDRRVGDRAGTVYAWGTLAASGARLAGGSDAFTLLFAPMADFYAAATRKNGNGRPLEGWHPGERLSRERALGLLQTLHAPGGGAPVPRRIVAGAPADLVVLSADPLTAPEERILGISVRATLSGGAAVFSDGSLAGLSTAAGSR